MDCLKYVIFLVYLVKQLNDIGKLELIESLLDSPIIYDKELDFDIYYDAVFTAIDNIFEYSTRRYYENNCFELTVLSDKVMVDYYILAGEFGKQRGISDKENPYIIDAMREAERHFKFSYDLSWLIYGYTEPKRPFHSRLAIIIYDGGDIDMIGVAIGVAAMYKFFQDKCSELRGLLSKEAFAA